MKALLKNVLLACGLSAALPAAATPGIPFGPFSFNGSQYEVREGPTDSTGLGLGKTWAGWAGTLTGNGSQLAIISTYEEYVFVRGIVENFYNAYLVAMDPDPVLTFFAFGNGSYLEELPVVTDPLSASYPGFPTFNPWIAGLDSTSAATYGAFFSVDCSLPPGVIGPSTSCGSTDARWVYGASDFPSYAVFEESIPVPATMALIGLGLVGLGLSSRRRA